MNYGLYLSASGVLTTSHRQDVIANNLANAETVGFKRDLALYQERLTRSGYDGRGPGRSDPVLEMIGGGVRTLPTATDWGQGPLEQTGNPLDVAIHGRGYFKVEYAGQQHLTRDGRFMIDREGRLILASGNGRVLDESGRPIVLEARGQVEIDAHGRITQGGWPTHRVGLVDVADPALLRKEGGNLLSYPQMDRLVPAAGLLSSGFVERSNVEPASELVALMEAHRLLEANANMIRYQDQTLGRLVNDVGRIG